jgi:hypothetical protein
MDPPDTRAVCQTLFMDRFFCAAGAISTPPEPGSEIVYGGEAFLPVRRFYSIGVRILLFKSESARFAVHCVDEDFPDARDLWGGEIAANMGVYDTLAECIAGVGDVWFGARQRASQALSRACV